MYEGNATMIYLHFRWYLWEEKRNRVNDGGEWQYLQAEDNAEEILLPSSQLQCNLRSSIPASINDPWDVVRAKIVGSQVEEEEEAKVGERLISSLAVAASSIDHSRGESRKSEG